MNSPRSRLKPIKAKFKRHYYVEVDGVPHLFWLDDKQPVYRIKKAAMKLDMSEGMLRKEICAKRIGVTYVGRRMPRVPQCEIERLLIGNFQPPRKR